MQHRADVNLVLIFDVRLTPWVSLQNLKRLFWWINHLTKQRKHKELRIPAKTLMLNKKLWYLLTSQNVVIEVGPVLFH